MTGADLDELERWLEQKIRTQEIGMTDAVLEVWKYHFGVGVKAGFRQALDELRQRRSKAGHLPEDRDT